MGINLTSYAIIGAIVFALLGLLGALITIKVVRTLTDKNNTQEYEEEEIQERRPKVKKQSKPMSQPVTIKVEEVQEIQTRKLSGSKELVFTKVEDMTKVQVFVISESQSLTIGRSKDKNTWGIIDDQTISSKHCKIYIIEDSVYIDDLNSTNGTYINRTRIMQPTRINNQDKIQIGASEYIIAIKNY